MPKSLQAALIPVFTVILTAAAVRFGLDPTSMAMGIAAIAAALAALAVAGYGWLMNHLQVKQLDTQAAKIQQAETILPGITQVPLPSNAEISARAVINDPATPDPPMTLSNSPQPPTPDGGIR
ncbi:MAG TPA: hypothetical protein VHM90_06775 [Phycisphaerae bacterium]|nr:hypothetical protein [Phycisphaerae bacterium]